MGLGTKLGTPLGNRLGTKLTGGGGDPITAMLFRQWRADVGYTRGADGETARWVDRCVGAILEQATHANKPTQASGVVGGQDSLQFDGTTDYLDSAEPAANWRFLHDGTGVEWYAVFLSTLADASSNTPRVWTTFNGVGATQSSYLIRSTASILLYRVTNGTGNMVSLASVGGGFLQNTLSVAMGRYQEGVNPEASSDGNQFAEVTMNSTAAPSSADPVVTLRVGAGFGGGQFLTGHIAELGFVKGRLTTGKRAELNAYLLDRYGAAA